MNNRLLASALIIPLLAACASPGPASISATNTTEPAKTVTPTTAVEPASYSSSLLATRWDQKIRHHLLLPVNPANGEPIPGYAPIDLGVNYYHAFSPNCKILAIISYLNDSPTDPLLHIIDLVTWREKTLNLELTGWSNTITFSPDSASIAAAFTYRDSNLLVIDLEQNTVRAQTPVDFSPRFIKFTRDGAHLMAYGRVLVDRFTENEHSEGDARVALFNANDLSLLWSADASGVRDGIYPVDAGKATNIHQPGNAIYLSPGVIFAPEADKLYAVHADGEKLTSVDFASRSMITLEIAPEISWFERFLTFGTGIARAKVGNGSSIAAVISPDGKIIYTTGMKHEAIQQAGSWEFKSTPLGLQAIRAADGRLLFEKDVFAEQISMAADGSRLFLSGWRQGDSYGSASTDIFDLRSSEFSLHLTGVELSPAQRLDGSLVLVSAITEPNSGEATRMSLHAYDSGEMIAEWISPTYAGWITSP